MPRYASQPDCADSLPLCFHVDCLVQALAEADAIDAKAAAGQDITPLCGLPLAVKDSTDVKVRSPGQTDKWT